MLRIPNNKYLTIEEFQKESLLYFDTKIIEYFVKNSPLCDKLKAITQEQLKDLTIDNFKIKFLALLAEIENIFNKTDPFVLEITFYVDFIYCYKKQEDPAIISSHDFKWESQEERNKEWEFATQKLTPNGQLSPDGTKLRRKDTSNNLSHSYIIIGRRILAMGSKNSSIITGPASYARNVKWAEDKNRGTWALKILHGKIISRENRIAMDLGMALPLIIRESKLNVYKTYIPYVYAGITLFQHLHSPKTHTVEHYLDIVIGLVKAAINLHSGKSSRSKKKYVHTDLHLGNVTIDNKGKIHFIDFGNTHELDESIKKEVNGLREEICNIFRNSESYLSPYFSPYFKIYLYDLYFKENYPLPTLLLDLKTFKEKLFPPVKAEGVKNKNPLLTPK